MAQILAGIVSEAAEQDRRQQLDRWITQFFRMRQRPLRILALRGPEWPRLYWLAEPIELPRGTTIEVTAVLAPPDPDEIPSPRRGKCQVALDYVG